MVLFIPALLTRSALTALPYVVLAAVFLSAQNPPIDAARLDIMPPWLWGRAEGVRNFVRTGAQALAPVLFGAVSQYVFGGGNSGLRWTFVVMMVPLSASALFLFAATRRYPVDVATAAAVAAARPRGAAPPARRRRVRRAIRPLRRPGRAIRRPGRTTRRMRRRGPITRGAARRDYPQDPPDYPPDTSAYPPLPPTRPNYPPGPQT